MSILIKNGKVIDPANKRDGAFDILIEGGKIARVGHGIKQKTDVTVDAKGKIVMPGLIDMHVHLREPGREDKETILTGSRAAVKGGFTTVACMPNTTPACDNQETVKFIVERAKQNGLINVVPVGAITKNREGRELAEIAELKESGCVALSDDGNSVPEMELMRRAMEYASSFGLPIISHCEDKSLSEGAALNEGFVSTVLGLKGMPNKAESIIIQRDIELAEIAGARVHIAHVSTKEGVDIIRSAKKRGIRVTAEVTPHHLALTDECCRTYDTNTKVNPPLRTALDVAALAAGLKDGAIDAVASDHAPHLDSEKDVEFGVAPFGMIGLETALAVVIMELHAKKILSWQGIAEKMSVNPARILGLEKGNLGEGRDADVTVIDPSAAWTYSADRIVSKSKNSPFVGWQFKGRASHVIAGGRLLLSDGEFV